MVDNFCTIFDSNYLSQGMVLWRSLQAVEANAKLWVVALDDMTAQYLRGLNVVTLPELEESFPELSAARSSRSRGECFFTLTPFIPTIHTTMVVGS
ncbi:MAG: hypothetical protein J6386_15705 [Candidatus Synoicihabitans palmerolidicus]|nr:hypothetical protein [Candidatus Synoicihabitans palmerolidicus]